MSVEKKLSYQLSFREKASRKKAQGKKATSVSARDSSSSEASVLSERARSEVLQIPLYAYFEVCPADDLSAGL